MAHHTVRLPSLETLRQLLEYDPETGIFTWRVRAASRRLPGEVAGNVRSDGYRRIGIGGVQYRAHRLAFLMMEGGEPSGLIDHIDGDKDNNRWSNLRDVTNAENCWAVQRKPRGTGSKYQGVGKKKHRWRSRIKYLNKEIHLGYFDTEQEALAAYSEAEARLHNVPSPRVA